MNQHSVDANDDVFRMATAFVNETSLHVFLTGKAGTGKTTFLRHIRKNTEKIAVVAAPTGIAAINAGGVTLHSLFQLPFEPYVPGGPLRKEKTRFAKAKLDLIRNLQLLIIDEVSMLRTDILDAIDKTLQTIRRNDRSFGGVQMLYIGDMFQLPPVVKDNEWALLRPHYESPFFFDALAIKKTRPIYLELQTVYRQSEKRFIDLLNKVRDNCLTQNDLRAINARYRPNFQPAPADNFITLTTHNAKAERINRAELGKLPGREHVFLGEIAGEFPEYALPAELNLCLKAEARVMFIRNDQNGRYFNGKMATVKTIADDRIAVAMADSDELIEVAREIWENSRYQLNKETGAVDAEIIGTFTQYPLKLAWAVTIHKSQGLTFQRAVIDIGSSFAPGQTYVALSRCVSLDGIVLVAPILPSSVMTDSRAVNFSKTAKDKTELLDILEEGKRRFRRERLPRYFVWRPMYTFLWEFERLLKDKLSEEYEEARILLDNFRKTVREMDEISGKFANELTTLIDHAENTGDLDTLRERCQKAVTYFHENTVDRIINPLQNYLDRPELPRRAKTFHKNLGDLLQDARLFLGNMKKVRYGDTPLADTLELPDPLAGRRKDDRPRPEDAGEGKSRKTSNPKAPGMIDENGVKIDTKLLSLRMFQTRKNIQEIAAERGLAETTIEGHLAEYIGAEIPVAYFFTDVQLEELKPIIAPLLDMEKPAFKPAYEKLGGKYSYGRLKMAYNYLLKMDNSHSI